MSATTLYVKACRCLYSNEGEDDKCWKEMLTLVPQIRNALSCRVCRGLIVDPQSSKYCQHYVCRDCLKKKKALNPGCKWCLDWSKLQQSDRQVRVVLACYKLLCETIRSSSIYQNSNLSNAKIDMLLDEAISNQDKLPESNILSDNNSAVFLGNLEDTPAALQSRDEIGTNERENVTKNVNKPRQGRKGGIKRKISNCKMTAINKHMKHTDSVTATSKKSFKQNPGVQRRTKKSGSDGINPRVEECEINNNNVSLKKTFIPKYTVMHNNINMFPKTRRQSLVRHCDLVRFNKKRKFRPTVGGHFQDIKISINKCWEGKPIKWA